MIVKCVACGKNFYIPDGCIIPHDRYYRLYCEECHTSMYEKLRWENADTNNR